VTDSADEFIVAEMHLPMSEWRCSDDELARIMAEMRPMIDRFAATSSRNLLRWAREQELAALSVA
jgi:hypothetical protein